MIRKSLLFAALSAALALAVTCQAQVPAAQIAIGGKVPDLQFQSLDDKTASLYQFKGSRGTLLLFVATRCPVSNDYNQRMADLAREYAARGFAVLGVNSNRTEPADEVARHAAENRLAFAIVRDPDNRAADFFGASVTPEAFLFDATWTLRYHGRIDDSRNPANITSRDLRGALDALEAAKPVLVAETKAFGCTIKRVPRR
jgi:peroxiredoxin